MTLVLNITVLLALWVFLFSRPTKTRLWRATTTPLASIIGSGFLIIGPILGAEFGLWAPAVMMALCAMAYAFGGAIRFNISRLDHAQPTRFERRIETLSEWSLGIAYIISVAYYLNLFGAFAVSLFPTEVAHLGTWITTLAYIVIIALGWGKGFRALERLEGFTVGLKLAIISALLVGLALFGATHGPINTAAQTFEGLWSQQSLFLVFGLLVTVQGFETSRYLGQEYTAAERIQSMKLAQWSSSGIYLGYVTLLVFFIDIPSTGIQETEIIDLMAIVSPLLPIILVMGALAAQASAAIADTAGAGGLFSELSRNRLAPKQSYLGLAIIGLILTWSIDIFAIISLASRAFALYYTAQSVLAAYGAYKTKRPRTATFFISLAIVGLAITLFGASVE